MRRVGVVIAVLVAGTMTASCEDTGSAGSFGGSSSNAGSEALRRIVDAFSYSCPHSPETVRVTVDASNTFGGGSSTMWEIANLNFSVQEAELQAVDRRNGVTSAGWIMFDDDVLIRERSHNFNNGWYEWGSWRSVDQGDPAMERGHYIIQQNGGWQYQKRGYQWFGDEPVFKTIVTPTPRPDFVWDDCR